MPRRFDIGLLPVTHRDADGNIRALTIVTRTGIFEYRNADGSIRRELRTPEEVFKQKSLDSLKMIPITNNHPIDFVTPKNAKQLQIGFTGETVSHDDSNVMTSVTINTDEGVSAVDKGKRQFSLGYDLELDFTPGTYQGERYDAIQKNIKYNHLALVDNARAGQVASLRLDSEDAVLNEVAIQSKAKRSDNNPNNPKEKEPVMAKVTVNGIEYDAVPEVKNALTQAQDALEKAKAEKAKLQKNHDSLSGELDAKKEELQKLQNKDSSEAIEKAVKSRLELVEKCRKHIDSEEDISSLSDKELKAKVISKVSEVNLDGKSDDYLNARFDAAIDVLTANSDEQSRNNDDNFRADDKNKPAGSADAARKKMIERLSKHRDSIMNGKGDK